VLESREGPTSCGCRSWPEEASITSQRRCRCRGGGAGALASSFLRGQGCWRLPSGVGLPAPKTPGAMSTSSVADGDGTDRHGAGGGGL
jgi:hypothetical protein